MKIHVGQIYIENNVDYIMKSEIKSYLIKCLEEELDEYMNSLDFIRSKTSLIYSRKTDNGCQKIDLGLQFHPSEDRNAAASIYPFLEVKIFSIDKIIDNLTAENKGLLAGITEGKTKQPIGINSCKKHTGKWYIYQSDSVRTLVNDVKLFLKKWTIPFLDNYQTPIDVVRADSINDKRVLVDYAQKLRVIEAIYLAFGPIDAIKKAEMSFGSKGLRRRYATLYDFLEAQK